MPIKPRRVKLSRVPKAIRAAFIRDEAVEKLEELRDRSKLLGYDHVVSGLDELKGYFDALATLLGA